MEDWSLEEHLEELRKRILFCLFFFLPALVIGFAITPTILQLLEALAPKGTIFFQLKPGELLFVYIRLCFILASALTIPFCLKQAADFISPGLKPKEKQIGHILLFGGPFLFFAGIAFSYWIALKPLLAFLLGFGVDLALIQPQYSLDYYISLVVGIMLLFGITFQVPIILFILALLDLVTSAQLMSYWKYAVFISFVIAAIVTPTPDPINMLILGFAIAALYGISLIFIKLSGK